MPLSDFLPDFSDPNSMGLYGGLANMLMAGGTPIRGTGMGAGNALAMLAGAGMQGAQAGAGGAQQFQQQNIANQMGQLGLEKQQALQPLQINMLKSAFNGASPSTNGSIPSGVQSGTMQGASTGGNPADSQFAQAYSLALASGDMAKAAGVLQAWAENNPELKGAIQKAQQANTITDINGHKVMGSAITGQGVPSMNASQLGAPQPQSGGIQPPPDSNVDWNDPVAVAKAKNEAEATGKNTAEADKAVSAIIGRLPNAFGIIDKMNDLAPKALSGPYLDQRRDFFNAIKDPSATATDEFNKYNENLFTQELPAIVQNSGGRIDIPLVKAIQAASAVPMDAQPATKQKLLSDTKDLLGKVRDNALATYKAQTGKDFDLGRAFDNPDDVKQAYQAGVLTKAQAKKLLQQNHGYK